MPHHSHRHPGIDVALENAGDFGGLDRMDYTIIGAEATLAARLQSMDEPGGIVMSYETYALVQDRARARPLEPIALKGISRQVVPYEIQGILEEGAETAGCIVEHDTDRRQLHIGLADLAEGESEEIKIAVEAAIKRVQDRNSGSS